MHAETVTRGYFCTAQLKTCFGFSSKVRDLELFAKFMNPILKGLHLEHPWSLATSLHDNKASINACIIRLTRRCCSICVVVVVMHDDGSGRRSLLNQVELFYWKENIYMVKN